MTMWDPDLNDAPESKYVAIADAIADDVASSKLQPGQRLPTQRALAKRLGVTVGTIGRAYALAEKRGLISLEVGRGSFISSFESRSKEYDDRRNEIDLGLNLPPLTQHPNLLSRTLSQISNSRDIASLFGNAPVESFKRHREAAAEWLSGRIDCKPEDLLICNGTQNGLVAALASLTKPNDSVLVEELTFPGMISAARLLHLKLVPVKMDEEGIIPSELAKVASTAKVLYCVPTNQNPTAATMSKTRRSEIANVATKKGLFVIEDDVYGKLIENCPVPVSTLIPDRAIYLASLAKTMAVGLRLAFVRVPRSLRDSMFQNMRATNFFPAPLLSEVVARWIEDGTGEQLLQELKSNARARQAIAKQTLPNELILGKPTGNHLWLNLPPAWQPQTLLSAARENGVYLYSADLFVPQGTSVPNAVRVSLGAARNESELKIGLSVIARLLDGSGGKADSAAKY